MMNSLIIGSSCVDVTLNIPNLPKPGQDENISSQHMSVGGCAFNVSSILRQFKLPYTLCSPVGSGIYGDFIKNEFNNKKIPIFAYTPEIENGCCYCIVEENGRRTFLCKHGAEYLFNENWFKSTDLSNIDYIYFCGLEIEDVDGNKIISFLEQIKNEHSDKCNKPTLIFAPGPRINVIEQRKLDRIFALNPILHLNDEESISFTKTSSVKDAAKKLFEKTNNSIIITCGKSGAYCYDNVTKEEKIIPCKKSVNAIDTTGAGDSHCGTVIASLKQGFSLFEAVTRANQIASIVVTKQGANLSDEVFNSAIKEL